MVIFMSLDLALAEYQNLYLIAIAEIYGKEKKMRKKSLSLYGKL